MVRIYINFVTNALGLSSMPFTMAKWIAENVGSVWPMFAASVGALGAFIAGSITVSNLMFSLFQKTVADSLFIFGTLVVTLQTVGGAAGVIHNVVAASATIGMLGQEGTTLCKTIIPTIYYLTVVGILGLIAVYVLGVSDSMLN